MDRPALPDLRFALLNDWQRGFPIVDAPFAAIGDACGVDGATVLDHYRRLLHDGAISRIGGVWGAGAGGAALLCAFSVPEPRLEAVAAQVSAHTGVNHNYEREHHHNLWFVITGRDTQAVADAVDALERQTGCRALRLRMRRAYRIDLGFDLRNELAASGCAPTRRVAPVDDADAPLAALVEDGLPLIDRPFDRWSDALCLPREQVLATVQRWVQQGTLRRFGAIVRHHEAGFAHNAMTVFDVPDGQVDHCGAVLAGQRGVTLAYRRERAEGWPYNLYCMVHGRDRSAVRSAIASAIECCGLDAQPHAVLFSRRRFKQVGARYFSGLSASVLA
ncbi:MAG: Lrp/AsnC family transcriptional regulator [Pseudomonadota bacterium]|nr:Lrp/AsnC family transcriptional regulator [Pseudomonadota bacterium]